MIGHDSSSLLIPVLPAKNNIELSAGFLETERVSGTTMAVSLLITVTVSFTTAVSVAILLTEPVSDWVYPFAVR